MNHQKWRWRRFDNSTCGAKMSDVLRYTILCVPRFRLPPVLCICVLREKVNEKNPKKIIKKQKVSLFTHELLSHLFIAFLRHLLLVANQNTTYTPPLGRRRQALTKHKPRSSVVLSALLMMMKNISTLTRTLFTYVWICWSAFCERQQRWHERTLTRIKTYAWWNTFKIALMDHIFECMYVKGGEREMGFAVCGWAQKIQVRDFQHKTGASSIDERCDGVDGWLAATGWTDVNKWVCTKKRVARRILEEGVRHDDDDEIGKFNILSSE